jgi:GT2 family glycosyltransferase
VEVPASTLPDRDCSIFSPCAAAALYAKPAFDALGGFDESFFCYLEDVDLGFRLRLRGEQCVQVRRAEVLHVGSAIAGRMSDFAVFHTFRNRIWLAAKDFPWPLLPPVACLQAASTAFSAFRPSARAYRWAAIKGAWAGITGLPAATQARRAVQRQRIVSSLEVARMLVWNPVGRRSRMPPPVPTTPSAASIAEASVGES